MAPEGSVTTARLPLRVSGRGSSSTVPPSERTAWNERGRVGDEHVGQPGRPHLGLGRRQDGAARTSARQHDVLGRARSIRDLTLVAEGAGVEVGGGRRIAREVLHPEERARDRSGLVRRVTGRKPQETKRRALRVTDHSRAADRSDVHRRNQRLATGLLDGGHGGVHVGHRLIADPLGDFLVGGSDRPPRCRPPGVPDGARRGRAGSDGSHR